MRLMRTISALVLFMAIAGQAQAQVINGESTDDAAYAPRPAARWHSPESLGVVPDTERDEAPDPNGEDRGIRSSAPRD